MKSQLWVLAIVSLIQMSSAQACKFCYRPGAAGDSGGTNSEAGASGGTRIGKPLKPVSALDDEKKFFQGATTAQNNAPAPAEKEKPRRNTSDFETESVYGAQE